MKPYKEIAPGLWAARLTSYYRPCDYYYMLTDGKTVEEGYTDLSPDEMVAILGL